MKSENPLIRDRCAARKSENGFARVITLALMILLTALAMGLLSLSSVALRNSSVQSRDFIARVALIIAIGELQKHAEADQRVTACANLLDAGSPNPMWTAVWKSRGGEPAYLVSGNEQASMNLETMPTSQPAQYYKVGTKLTDGGSVALFGSQLTGTEQVRAPLVNVGGTNSGSYAYWIADEGVKARFNTRPPCRALLCLISS